MGKVEEQALLIEQTMPRWLFDDELSPAQGRERRERTRQRVVHRYPARGFSRYEIDETRLECRGGALDVATHAFVLRLGVSPRDQERTDLLRIASAAAARLSAH